MGHCLRVGSVNLIGEALDDFYAPLSIESARDSVRPTTFFDALRNPKHRKVAAKEAGGIAVKGALAIGITAASVVYVVSKTDKSGK